MQVVEIKIDNVWGKVVQILPQGVFDAVRKECSYIPKAAEYTARTYGYRPTSIQRFNKKDQSFRVGLLNRVRATLREFGMLSVVVDNRINKEIEDDIKDYKLAQGIEIRDYQSAAVKEILINKRAAQEIATGGGKTLIMAAAIAEVQKPTMVLTNSTVLMYQTARAIGEAIGTKVGMIGDSVFEPRWVTVAMVQSLEGACDKYGSCAYKDDKIDLIKKTKFLIVDECHRIAAKTIFDLSADFEAAGMAAFFTATMRRLDGRDLDLEAAAGPINYHIPMIDLIRGGYLVAPEILYLDVPERMIPPNRSYLMTTKKYDELREFYIDQNDERNELIAEAATELVAKQHPTLIAVRHIDHGNRIKALLPSACEIYGDTSDRVKKFEEFEKGNIQLVISTLCKEGFDCPRLSAVIVAYDCQDTEQIVGRIVRLFPNKDRAIVIHLVDKHPIFKRHVRHCEKIFYSPQKISRTRISKSRLSVQVPPRIL
jgi:superfamily II DNA or RNA helicase